MSRRNPTYFSPVDKGWGAGDSAQQPVQDHWGQFLNRHVSIPPGTSEEAGADAYAPTGAMGHLTAAHNASGAGTADFGDGTEPPLLEELGVNFDHIRTKTLAVINPVRMGDVGQALMEDADLAGPLLFLLALGFLLLVRGRLHFGALYGVSLAGSFGMFALLNVMCPVGVNASTTTSVLGYCILPIDLLALLALITPVDGLMGLICGLLVVAWSTYSAAYMFVQTLQLREQRLLVAYPLFVLYTCIVMIVLL